MKQRLPLLTLLLVASCVSNAPRYREVTLIDNGNYALSRQSVDAFQAEREVESRARHYCREQQGAYQRIDEQSSYVNGASGPMHRVTLYFQCPAADSTVANAGSAGEGQALAAAPAAASTPPASDTTAASPNPAESAVDPLMPAAGSVSAASRTASETQPDTTKRAPEPPFREVAALSEGLFGITRQSLEPFNSSRAVWTQAESYCGERQLQVEEVDRQESYVNGSGNNQAHRITLYFRCYTPPSNAISQDHPEPPFHEVTALGEGQFGITRQSLEPFGSGRAVQAQAENYCGDRQQRLEEIDRQLLYVNRGSNEPAHRTTLYFRCTP